MAEKPQKSGKESIALKRLVSKTGIILSENGRFAAETRGLESLEQIH